MCVWFYFMLPVQAMSKVRAEAEEKFDLESVKSHVAESFKQVEEEISEQVSVLHSW